MDIPTLTIIDSTGIQDYIFGSNKVKENIGASYLLKQIDGEWLYDALEEVTSGAHNLKRVQEKRETGNTQDDEPLVSFAIDSLAIGEHPRIEVIYRGGGNILLRSRTKTDALALVRALSSSLLLHAPGLAITAAHYPLQADEPIGGKDGAYRRLLEQLQQANQQRRASLPQLGLAVTLACRATGLPANEYIDEPIEIEPTTRGAAPIRRRPVSSAIKSKHTAVDKANKQLGSLFGEISTKYKIGQDFDDFGRSRDDTSYIAVIHADGNRMGDRFRNLVEYYDDASQNDQCLAALRTFSEAVEASGKAALQEVVKQVNDAFATSGHTELDERMKRFVNGLSGNRGAIFFPVRPLVFGGDDLTLVCDGRLGLGIAAAYLEAFHSISSGEVAKIKFEGLSEEQQKELRRPIHACAGVAIVKTHYPFARAYQLAEALCASAKASIRDLSDASVMDWHFATTGLHTDLSQIRKRQYMVKEGSLLMRPIIVSGPALPQSWRNWETLDGLIKTFINDESWSERHNKVVALREALRAGKDAVKQFLHNYQIGQLPEVASDDDKLEQSRTTGWESTPNAAAGGASAGPARAVYYDAIELLDFYLPIAQREGKQP